MPISFTGIKNIGAMCVPDRDSNSVFYTLSMQVTNDSDGNDLDKFEKVINDVTNNHPEKFLVPYKGAISFNVVEHPPEDKFSGSTYNFYLNGTPLKIDDKNLKAFSYMAKIFNKVSKKDDDEFNIEKNYFMTRDFLNGSTVGYFIQRDFIQNPGMDIYNSIKRIYSPENVRVGARIVNSAIDEMMVDYFA